MVSGVRAIEVTCRAMGQAGNLFGGCYQCRSAPFPSVPGISDSVPVKPDTVPDQIGHCSGVSRTAFRAGPKSVRYQPGILSDINRNAVRFESEHCPTSIGMSVRFAPEYAIAPTAPRLRY